VKDVKKYSWLLVLIGLVVAFLFLRKIFTPMGLFGDFMGGLKPNGNQQIESDLQTVINGTVVDASKVNKTPQAIAEIAVAQYTAMKGLGTDEKKLFDSLMGCNDNELKAVYKQFGIQEDTVFGIAIYRNSLVGWYRDELTGADLEKMKQIWKTTGLFS
jgi:hypothetical protein